MIKFTEETLEQTLPATTSTKEYRMYWIKTVKRICQHDFPRIPKHRSVMIKCHYTKTNIA